MIFRKKVKLLLIGVLSLLSLTSFGANEKEIIYNAYITDNMSIWKKTIDAMDAETNKTIAREFELLNYEYGYIAWCVGKKKTDEANLYLNKGTQRITKLETYKKSLGLIYAYQSAFYGYQIGMNKIKAPFLGPKSIEVAKKSVTMNINNYFGYMQLGNIEYYMPPVFGGSKEKALDYYLRAKEIMDKRDNKNDWNYLNLIAVIGMTYQELNNYNKAEAYYKLALKQEP
ncbi:MAG: tetratricopeptide repeat protein, partial [Bacteroidales bacterium]